MRRRLQGVALGKEAEARQRAVLEKAVRDTDVAYREFAGGNVSQRDNCWTAAPRTTGRGSGVSWTGSADAKSSRRNRAMATCSRSALPATGPLISGGAAGVQQWNPALRKPKVVTEQSVTEMAVSADGNRVAEVSRGKVTVYDRAKWESDPHPPPMLQNRAGRDRGQVALQRRAGATLLDVSTKVTTAFAADELHASCIALRATARKPRSVGRWPASRAQ